MFIEPILIRFVRVIIEEQTGETKPGLEIRCTGDLNRQFYTTQIYMITRALEMIYLAKKYFEGEIAKVSPEMTDYQDKTVNVTFSIKFETPNHRVAFEEKVREKFSHGPID